MNWKLHGRFGTLSLLVGLKKFMILSTNPVKFSKFKIKIKDTTNKWPK